MCGVNRSHNEPCARTADLDELKSRGVYSELCCHSSQKNDKPQSQPVRGSGTLWIQPSWWIFRLLPYSEINIKNRILNKSYRGPRARRPVKKNGDSKMRWCCGGVTWLHHVKIFFMWTLRSVCDCDQPRQRRIIHYYLFNPSWFKKMNAFISVHCTKRLTNAVCVFVYLFVLFVLTQATYNISTGHSRSQFLNC